MKLHFNLILLLAAALVRQGQGVEMFLSNGATLTLELVRPPNNQEFLVPSGAGDIDVELSALASVGPGNSDVTYIYVLDESASVGTDLLAAIRSFFAVLTSVLLPAPPQPTLALNVGVVAFSSTAVIRQDLTNDPVAVFLALVQPPLYTSTNCELGLGAALTLAQSASAGGRIVVLFAGDGECTGDSAAVTAAADALAAIDGLTIDVLAISSAVDCGNGSLGSLVRNGGTCRQVNDISEYNPVEIVGTKLVSGVFTVDGIHVSPIASTLVLPSDSDTFTAGLKQTTISATAGNLAAATHTVCAYATADGGNVPEGAVTAFDCHDIQLLSFSASPEADTNDLNIKTSHTITASIVGGTGPERPITFQVVEGPHSQDSVSVMSSDLSAEFTLTAAASCADLGEDVIKVSTVIGGVTEEVAVRKTWVDSSPPVATCVFGVNPDNSKPVSNNTDGFFTIGATDALGLASIKLIDKLTDYEFGTFVNGDNIKYTKAAGAQPKKKVGSGVIKWHLTGNGDLAVVATDCAGHTTEAICALRPPRHQRALRLRG